MPKEVLWPCEVLPGQQRLGCIVSPALPHEVWVHSSSVEGDELMVFNGGDEVECNYQDRFGVQDSWHYRTTWVRTVPRN